MFKKLLLFWAGEMAQSVNYMSCKLEAPRTHVCCCFKRQVWSHTFIIPALEKKTGRDPWGSLQLAQPTWEIWANERDCCGQSLRISPRLSSCVHICMYSCTKPYTRKQHCYFLKNVFKIMCICIYVCVQGGCAM